MSQINAQVRLRPLRIAFLVHPDDLRRTIEIFRANTCLWGGKYNPVIPYLTTIPKWWDRHGFRFENATQIINGYLDFFEPDFLVESEQGIAAGLGFDEERVIQLTDLLRREGDGHWDGTGLNVFELYRDLYQKEFQFARRHEHNIIEVACEKPTFAGLAACLFGAFPQEEGLSYIGKAFTDAFAPKKVSLNPAALLELYKSGWTSALRLGYSKNEVRYHGHRDPTLFVLDALKASDLIDFWNLRAVRGQIVPIPKQWLPELSPWCREFITANHRPLPGNLHGVMIETTVMFSRSIPSDSIEQLHKEYFSVDPPAANIRQDWYPSLWRPSPEYTVREMRPTLSAEEKSFDCPFDTENPRINFESLHPEFADEHANKNRWANVVRLRDWSHESQVATTFPTNYKDPKLPRFRLGDEAVLATTEGFVFFPRFTRVSEHWQLSSGTEAFKDWLTVSGIKATLSDAGRATHQIIKATGRFGMASLANPEIIEMLNALSRKPISPSAHYKKLRNQVENATKRDIWGRRTFETLVERNVLELGLELRCTKCSSWNWYSLKEIDYRVRCALCLQQFEFPILDPGSSAHSRWAYRLIGPFALPSYAGGGYGASLAVRFFSDVLGQHDQADVTWSAGQNLELVENKSVEADFILWYQRKQMFGNDYPTDLVFGEAKSFGKETFKADDIDRMKQLALRFPGAILVFATMKRGSELSSSEVKRMSQLALWGRESPGDKRQTRAPVIVLTGTELFSRFSLRESWEKIGGRHAQFCQIGMLRFENLQVLADLTQQLYLGLPPYSQWLEEKWRKRKERRSARAKKQEPPVQNQPDEPVPGANQAHHDG